jgi:hypothetical protein
MDTIRKWTPFVDGLNRYALILSESAKIGQEKLAVQMIFP